LDVDAGRFEGSELLSDEAEELDDAEDVDDDLGGGTCLTVSLPNWTVGWCRGAGGWARLPDALRYRSTSLADEEVLDETGSLDEEEESDLGSGSDCESDA
jgi:hypothetical protein